MKGMSPVCRVEIITVDPFWRAFKHKTDRNSQPMLALSLNRFYVPSVIFAHQVRRGRDVLATVTNLYFKCATCFESSTSARQLFGCVDMQYIFHSVVIQESDKTFNKNSFEWSVYFDLLRYFFAQKMDAFKQLPVDIAHFSLSSSPDSGECGASFALPVWCALPSRFVFPQNVMRCVALRFAPFRPQYFSAISRRCRHPSNFASQIMASNPYTWRNDCDVLQSQKVNESQFWALKS